MHGTPISVEEPRELSSHDHSLASSIISGTALQSELLKSTREHISSSLLQSCCVFMLRVCIFSHSTVSSHPPRKEVAYENTFQPTTKKKLHLLKKKKKKSHSFFFLGSEVGGWHDWFHPFPGSGCCWKESGSWGLSSGSSPGSYQLCDLGQSHRLPCPLH